MKKTILCLTFLASLLISSTAYALDSATELMNLGMSPELAKKVIAIVNTLASPIDNNAWITARNAGNTADINMMKVDATDDTVLNADTGDILKLAIAGTAKVSMDTAMLYSVADGGMDLGGTGTDWKDFYMQGVLYNDGTSVNIGAALNGTATALDADLTTVTTAAPLIGIVGLLGTQHQVALAQDGANANGFAIDAFKTRATFPATDANTVVVSGDDILTVTAYGADGAAYRAVAQILMESGGTPGSSDMPGRIILSTTPDGSATLTTALTLDNTQLVTAANGLTVTTGNVTATNGEFISSTSGKTLALQEATAAATCMGTLTANGATPVVTATTCAITGSRIFLTRTSAETGTTDAWISALTTGTSFAITSEAADTGTYNWIIFHEAA